MVWNGKAASGDAKDRGDGRGDRGRDYFQVEIIAICEVGVPALSAVRPLASVLLLQIGNFTYEMLHCQGETAMDGGFRHLRHGCCLMPPRPFSVILRHFISGIRFAAPARKPKPYGTRDCQSRNANRTAGKIFEMRGKWRKKASF